MKKLTPDRYRVPKFVPTKKKRRQYKNVHPNAKSVSGLFFPHIAITLFFVSLILGPSIISTA